MGLLAPCPCPIWCFSHHAGRRRCNYFPGTYINFFHTFDTFLFSFHPASVNKILRIVTQSSVVSIYILGHHSYTHVYIYKVCVLDKSEWRSICRGFWRAADGAPAWRYEAALLWKLVSCRGHIHDLAVRVWKGQRLIFFFLVTPLWETASMDEKKNIYILSLLSFRGQSN